MVKGRSKGPNIGRLKVTNLIFPRRLMVSAELDRIWLRH